MDYSFISPIEEREYLDKQISRFFEEHIIDDVFTKKRRNFYTAKDDGLEISSVNRDEISSLLEIQMSEPNRVYFRMKDYDIEYSNNPSNETKLFVLDSEGNTYSLPLISEDSDNHSKEYVFELKFEIIERVLALGTRLSLRLGKLRKDFQIILRLGSLASLVKYIVFRNNLSDNEIDDIYDDVYASVLKYEERKLKEELEILNKMRADEKRIQKDKIDKQYITIVSKVKRCGVYNYDTLEQLITSPMEIPEIKELNDFCLKNKIDSNPLKYINSISVNYDTNKILHDIKRLRWKNHMLRRKLLKISGILVAILFLPGIIGGFEYLLDWDFWDHLLNLHWIILFLIIGVVVNIKIVYIMLHSANYPNLVYGEEASQLIEDFETELSKRNV